MSETMIDTEHNEHDEHDEQLAAKTALIDEFLERHSAGLPGHVIDFALDVRGAITDLEEELERLRQPEPVA